MHAEALNPDGSLYMANLRTARQQDMFVLSGTGADALTPKFALHGFRYVDISCSSGTLKASDVAVEVVHSDLPVTGSFHTSNEMVDRLQQCVVWSQRSNFVDIPVDCHQRDERLGWTGDINLFTPTALFNMDCSRFLRSWLRSLADCQLPHGSIPDIAPYVDKPLPPRDIQDGQAGWADAIVGVPWEIYVHTGDPEILEEFWNAMTGWMKYLRKADEGFVRSGGVFGDWNSLGSPTLSEVIGTAWFARSARTMAEVAKALGRGRDSREYRALYESIRREFQAQFVTEDGRVSSRTQTAYAMALDVDLLPKDLRAAATGHLVDNIAAEDWHLLTGFAGTECVLRVLSEGGRPDVAYRLLTQTTYPSWGFETQHGATTLWEHWDSWRPEIGFHDPKMNSFNHYAFATVGAWLYRCVAGINPDPTRPGYRRIRFRPYPNRDLGEVSATLESVSGRVSSSWEVTGGEVRLSLEVPSNCEGVLEMPWLRHECGIRRHRGNRLRATSTTNQGPAVHLGPGFHDIVTAYPRQHLMSYRM
jgi:alpha-L-rhamnosidase